MLIKGGNINENPVKRQLRSIIKIKLNHELCVMPRNFFELLMTAETLDFKLKKM